MRIIIVRHGQSVNNAAWLSGTQNVPEDQDTLSVVGTNQVMDLASMVYRFNKLGTHKGTTWKIFHSGKLRCKQTAQMLAQRMGLDEIHVDPRLDEIPKSGPNADWSWVDAVSEDCGTDVKVVVTHANAIRYGLEKLLGITMAKIAPTIACMTILDSMERGYAIHTLCAPVPSAVAIWDITHL